VAVTGSTTGAVSRVWINHREGEAHTSPFSHGARAASIPFIKNSRPESLNI